jgi:hypothetical protein
MNALKRCHSLPGLRGLRTSQVMMPSVCDHLIQPGIEGLLCCTLRPRSSACFQSPYATPRRPLRAASAAAPRRACTPKSELDRDRRLAANALVTTALALTRARAPRSATARRAGDEQVGVDSPRAVEAARRSSSDLGVATPRGPPGLREAGSPVDGPRPTGGGWARRRGTTCSRRRESNTRRTAAASRCS